MSDQAIPDDIMAAAEEALDLICCNIPEHGDFRAQSILDIARALLAERRKHDHPTHPDLQAVAERVFADVQRAVLVEDAKQVIAKAIQAAEQRGKEAMHGTFETYLSEGFGERCPEFSEGCPCCEAWAQFDALSPTKAAVKPGI